MKDFQGANFYDNPEVFERYIAHRKKTASPNKNIEKPVILEFIQGIKGKVLDLGCGYGDLVPDLLQKGIAQYTGIDASANMIELGKETFSDERVQFERKSLEEWEPKASSYNWVISRLVFHYIEDLSSIFKKIYSSLNEKGKLVFSAEHPVLTSAMHLEVNQGKKQAWTVDQYFEQGKRVQQWMGDVVIKYHRTLEAYWQMLVEAGFQIEEIREGCPDPASFEDKERYTRRKRIPLFLMIKAGKE